MKQRFWLATLLFHSIHFFQPAQAQYPGKNPVRHLLEGAVDMHIHSSPDAFDRSVNDLELAALAKRAGLRAIVIKNHVSSTAGRVELVNSQVEGIEVFGGVALNKAVGGINPHAVDWMARISPDYGKLVWFPTFDAAHHMAEFGMQGDGISILENGKLTSETIEVLKIIAREDLVLATGHLSPLEVKLLVEEARKMKISKIIITHPLIDAPNLNVDQMKELAAMGAKLELTYLSFLSGPQAPLGFLQHSKHVPISRMVEVIKNIGAENIILSTDLGQSGNAIPPDGLKNFVLLLLDAGITEEEIVMMIKINPSQILDL